VKILFGRSGAFDAPRFACDPDGNQRVVYAGRRLG
jgi:hypothetical protein